jgi:hypothetical protein
LQRGNRNGAHPDAFLVELPADIAFQPVRDQHLLGVIERLRMKNQ